MRWSQLGHRQSKDTATAVQIGLAFALAALAAVMLSHARTADWNDGRLRAENIASTLQRDIERHIDILDYSLRNASDGLQLFDQHQLSDDVKQAVLFDGALNAPQFGNMVVLNERGVMRYNASRALPPDLDFSGRDYFRVHRDHADRGLFVGLVPQNASSQEPTVVLSRRVNYPDGSFAGVVAGSLRMTLFADLFAALKFGPEDDVAVVATDGHAIYRRSVGSAYFGVDISGSRLFQATRDASAIIVQGPGRDGVPRLYAHQRLRNAPLAVYVGLSINTIYAAWRLEAWVIGTMLSGLLIVATMLAAGVRRELRRRAAAEAALNDSVAEYSLLADNMSDMVTRVGPDGDRRYVSPAAARLFGAPPATLLGHNMIAHTFPEDHSTLMATSRRLLADDFTFERNEFRIRQAGGAERWVETDSRGLQHPDTGAPDGYVSTWRDVTDRRRAEVLLAESETRYRLLAESTSDLIVCRDLSFRRTYVSSACRTMLGYEPDEMMGVAPAGSIHPDDEAEVLEVFSRLSSGTTESGLVTNRLLHKLGHYIWVEVSLALVREEADGAPHSVICAIRDISIRKSQADALQSANTALERLSRHLAQARDTAEQASLAKSRFLASISHELRTPLNGILGYAEMLRIEGELSSTQAPRVDAMLGAGQHLLEMINCVLDLTEVDTGHIELHPTETSLRNLAAACLDIARPTAERKNLVLSLQVAPDVPPRIMVDPTRLRQILLNLIGNAVKFTKAGRITVDIGRHGEERLRLKVTDTGQGVPNERRHELFQDFKRLGSGASVEGAGLGLALSVRLATVMGGTVGYEDNPGGGSVFWLDLPAIVIVSPSSAATSLSSEETPGLAHNLKVMVVDDMEMNRDIMGSFLRYDGHSVVFASSGEEAVSIASTMALDVILMDVQMPGIDGLEATRRIRALSGPQAAVPIVAVTGQAFAQQVAACRRAGMDSHVSKPFTQAALLASIRQIVPRDIAALTAAPPLHAAAATDLAARVNEDASVPLFGDEVPVLDTGAYDTTVTYLPRDSVSTYMHSLVDQTDSLLQKLRASPRHAAADIDAGETTLAVAAHSLAGSAGMFGFRRLATVGRHYERAVGSNLVELPEIVTGLVAAAEASLAEMRRLLAQ